MPSEEFDEILTIFQSSPLVTVIDEDNEGDAINGNDAAAPKAVEPIETFCLDREYEQLSQIFQDDAATNKTISEERVRVRVDREILTQARFQSFLKAKECHVVHFACSGDEQYLWMESSHGVMEKVPKQRVIDWIQASQNLQLVVVADADAEQVAETFLAAGIPHVVTCPVAKYQLDQSAVEFVKAFYLALVNNQTVQQGFNAALLAVKLSSHLNYSSQNGTSKEASSKYRLLPLDTSHDDVMFHENEGGHLSIKSNNQKTNRPQGILPLPPPIFFGRQKDVHQLLQDVETTRLIRVSGTAVGVGAASVVKMACQYMTQRPQDYDHDHVCWLPPPKMLAGPDDDVTQLWMRVLEPILQLESPEDEHVAELVDTLKSTKLLLVCDIRESRSTEVFNDLMDFLDELFEHSSTTKAIIIHEAMDKGNGALQLSSMYAEKSISIKPLGYTSTVTLFGLLCRHVKKKTSPSITNVEDFKKLLVPTAGYVGNRKLKKTIISIYNLLGQGVSSRIHELASSMTVEEYQSLIQVGKLRDKLSRLFQRQMDLAFPTRFSLDVHLTDISEAAEDARLARQQGEVTILEAQYAETGPRRLGLPSIETMLIQRKALKTEIEFAKLRGQGELRAKIKNQILGLEKSIRKEREAMEEAEEDWIELCYTDFPNGISRRTIDERYESKTHLLAEAKKTRDFCLARDLEFPLKELRESRSLLPTGEEWSERLDRITTTLKEAETSGNVDRVVALSDEVEQIEKRLEDEDDDVDCTRIANDLFIPLHSFLRFIGDRTVTNLPDFDTLESRGQINECLQQIIQESESSSDDLNIERYNSLVGLYQELCAIAFTKFPSIAALLLERKGYMLEEKLVYSQDVEIVKSYEVEIEAIEQRISRERRNSEPDQFFGVCKSFFFNGFTRALVDERIDELKDALEKATDEDNVFGISKIELELSELVRHQDKLPNEKELDILIERTTNDLEQLSARSGWTEKESLMEVALQDLKQRKRSEDNPEGRDKEEIAVDLMIPVADYYYPPSMNDSSNLHLDESDGSSKSERDDDSDEDEDLSTVDEDWESGEE